MTTTATLTRTAQADGATLTTVETPCLILDADRMDRNIARLRALGMRVALDDFGTGFSSLTHLQRLPIDSVKLDRSFAANMEDEVGGKVVAAVAGLCRTLDLTSLIEGIETPAQLRRARQYGYRYVQGYLFAQPMTIEALLRWLDEDRRPPLHGRSVAGGRAASVR